MSLVFILLIISYLLGSIPTSYIMGKLVRNIDIREHGSGNVGATNSLRVLGTKIGIFTLIIDVAKGALAVLFAKLIIEQPSNLLLVFSGLLAIIGHIFTIFLKFKGGKGVATSAGVFLILTPLATGITLLIFVITVWISKYVSLGSLLAALTLFIVELIININNHFADIELLIFILIIAIFIFIRHKANISRLLDGNENKLKF